MVRTKSTLATRLLLSAVIALPTAPVLVDYFGPSTRARWLLADAANQFDRGEVEKSQRTLENAFALSKDIVYDSDFWKQFERIEGDRKATANSYDIWEYLLKNVEDADQRAASAMEISQMMAKRLQFESAAKLLALHLPEFDDRTPAQQNQLAYMRSLAGIDLDEALRGINVALGRVNSESLMDTKAWILYRLGRNDDALHLIDQALSTLKGKLRANSSLEPMVASMDSIEEAMRADVARRGNAVKPKAPEASEAGGNEAAASEVPEEKPSAEPATEGTGAVAEPSEPAATKVQAEQAQPKPRGWARDQLAEEFPSIFRVFGDVSEVFVVMRYHKMRILEALGRTDDAELERRWVEAFSTEAFDSIH
ncbi:MAG: hypothetical protein ACK5OB_13640 [Pirellula sp.]